MFIIHLEIFIFFFIIKIIDCQNNDGNYSLSSSSLLETKLSSKEIFKNSKPKYLNEKCDFEKIPARGCHLRESYCSLHRCICKPDFPINIADRLCLAKLKQIGDQCEFDEECQPGSICRFDQQQFNDINHYYEADDDDRMIVKRKCQCKNGYIYSTKQQKCIKGLKGAKCTSDDDCHDNRNMFCSLITCECKYGYIWSSIDEYCMKRSKYDELCDQSINCKLYDEFSDCDPTTKRCVCGKFLSHEYILDEITRRCVSCPKNRLNQTTNTCLPEKTTVDYNQLNHITNSRNGLQQYSIYIVLSMAPFFIFALIGFIYRFINPYGTLNGEQIVVENGAENNNNNCAQLIDNNNNNFDDHNEFTIANNHSNNIINYDQYCLSVDLDMINNNSSSSNPMNAINTFLLTPAICDSNNHSPQPATTTTTTQSLQPSCLLLSSSSLSLSTHLLQLPPEPPPSYDLASQDMPPSYDEVIGEQQRQQQQQQQDQQQPNQQSNSWTQQK